MIITIDGLAGVGKTTLTLLLSKKFNLTPISSGNIYRAITTSVIISKTNLNNKNEIINFVKSLCISFKNEKILVNGLNIESCLHSPIVDKIVPHISSISEIRDFVNNLIKITSQNKPVIIEGRDMGKVFKDADLKIFLTASIEARAERRCEVDFNIVNKENIEMAKASILMRDKIVNERQKEGKLLAPKDSIIIDTTNLNQQQVFNSVANLIEKKLNRNNSCEML